MSDNPPKTRMVMGVELLAPISSVTGSSSLLFTQPLITGLIFESAAVHISAQVILLIADYFLGIKNVPVLNPENNKTVQLSLSELQNFLRWMTNRSESDFDLSSIVSERGSVTETVNNSSISTDRGGVSESLSEATSAQFTNRGFLTPERPEAPVILAVYVIANYSNKPYTPIIELIFPIFTFPGLRGSLPIIIVELLATIFVRAVVPPDTTGSKPLTKPKKTANKNNLRTISPSDLLELVTKFSKRFSSN